MSTIKVTVSAPSRTSLSTISLLINRVLTGAGFDVMLTAETTTQLDEAPMLNVKRLESIQTHYSTIEIEEQIVPRMAGVLRGKQSSK